MASEKNEMTVELWRLYDSARKVFFNNLDAVQLHKLIDSIPSVEIKYWHITKDGEVEWFPLEAKLKEQNRKEIGERPTGILSLDSFISEMSDTTKSFKIDKKKIGEKRKIKRLDKKVKIFIDVGEEILAAESKDISLFAIKLDKRFPLKYKGKFYPLTIKARPAITLRCTPLVTEKEVIRSAWNVVTLDPNFNLSVLAQFLKAD